MGGDRRGEAGDSVTEQRRVPLNAVREARVRDQVPPAVLRFDGPLSEAELADLRARWEEARGERVRILPVDVEVTGPALAGSRRRWLRRQQAGRVQG